MVDLGIAPLLSQSGFGIGCNMQTGMLWLGVPNGLASHISRQRRSIACALDMRLLHGLMQSRQYCLSSRGCDY